MTETLEETKKARKTFKQPKKVRERNRGKQKRYRNRKAQKGRRALSFFVDDHIREDLDVIKGYAKEKKFVFTYEAFFSALISKAASTLSDDRLEEIVLTDFAQSLMDQAYTGIIHDMNDIEESPFFKKLLQKEVQEGFAEFYRKLADRYPEEFSLDEDTLRRRRNMLP